MVNQTAATAMDEPASLASLLADVSLEMTARDVEQLYAAARFLPADTQVSITFLPHETHQGRVQAAAAVRAAGLQPVPHVAARQLTSAHDLESFLDRLAHEACVDRLFVISGDRERPLGPYADALAVISSGLLETYGVRQVGVAGYPDGHPHISSDRLWRALQAKHDMLAERGLGMSIMTQFGFDAFPILDWLARLRDHGVPAPVRIGVAGPAGVKTLLRFAARCGVGASAKAMARYGLSLSRLVGEAGPDRLIQAVAAGLDPAIHGDTALHFYPFGGLAKTAAWVEDFQGRAVRQPSL